MRIVIAPDSFKEAASAAVVAEAIAAGWRRVFPEADLELIPMADGGEGTVDAIVAAMSGEKIEVEVAGPLGAPVRATYAVIEDKLDSRLRGNDGNGARTPARSSIQNPKSKIQNLVTAVIEMAAASGLAIVPPECRDARAAGTEGTGELIRDALERGARKIIIGIGGSATNDGGAGMARALGYRLLDAEGTELPRGGAALVNLARIDASGKHPALETCEILVACDVTNPLCGPLGASRIFGPQKGASEEVVQELDAALGRFADVIEWQLGVAVKELPGAGAAGGLGAGLVAFTSAKLVPGAALIAETCRLAERMAGADLVITGEGRIDAQTAHGKTPLGVARVAKQAGVPVIAVAGTLGKGYEALYSMGIDAIFSICPGPITLEEAMAGTEELLADTARNVAALWSLLGKRK